MKMTLGIVLVSFCLLFGGTAIAADQNELPPILASLDHSENVILLDDHSMKQIKGEGITHPSWRDSIRGFLRDPRGTIKKHIPVIRKGIDEIKKRKAVKRKRIRTWLRLRFSPPS